MVFVVLFKLDSDTQIFEVFAVAGVVNLIAYAPVEPVYEKNARCEVKLAVIAVVYVPEVAPEGACTVIWVALSTLRTTVPVVTPVTPVGSVRNIPGRILVVLSTITVPDPEVAVMNLVNGAIISGSFGLAGDVRSVVIGVGALVP